MSIEKFTAPERPAYRVLDVAGFFGTDDTLYPEGAEIFFDGEPSKEMEPLNEPARIKMLALLEKLDNQARAVAEKLGRPFVGMPRTLDGALAIASEVQRMNMSVMGNTAKEVTNIEPIQREATSNMGDRPKRGRPRKVA